MTTTPVLGMTDLASGQSVPETTVNEHDRILEWFAAGAAIEDRDLSTPPGSPSDGQAWLVKATGTGAWSGKDGKLALYVGTGFLYFTAKEGMRIWIKDEDKKSTFDGSAWVDDVAGGSYSDEQARDAIGAMLSDSTTIDVTYNDAGDVETIDVIQSALKPTESLVIACSDETTALTTGTAKVTFRMPYAFTLSAVRASVTTAPTGSVLTVDINEGGASILSTKLTIDASEKTSTTAATPAVISDSALADDAEMTIDIDGVGSTIAGAGLKVYLIGSRT